MPAILLLLVIEPIFDWSQRRRATDGDNFQSRKSDEHGRTVILEAQSLKYGDTNRRNKS